jgi:transcriptional regulator with XRE-family HTH domain
MSRKTTVQLPVLQRLLKTLGENIRLARLRRRFAAGLIAERAGMTRNTLRAVERGDPGVTLGAYVNVLHCLGLEKDLNLIARDDELGRKLQDLKLPIRERAPKVKRTSQSSKARSHV